MSSLSAITWSASIAFMCRFPDRSVRQYLDTPLLNWISHAWLLFDLLAAYLPACERDHPQRQGGARRGTFRPSFPRKRELMTTDLAKEALAMFMVPAFAGTTQL